MGLADRARDAAKRAQEAAQRGASEAKDRAQGLNLRRRLNALAEELGHVVFRQREGEVGLDAEVDRLVAEMRGVHAEIDALDEEERA